jgi:hypothetical protein
MARLLGAAGADTPSKKAAGVPPALDAHLRQCAELGFLSRKLDAAGPGTRLLPGSEGPDYHRPDRGQNANRFHWRAVLRPSSSAGPVEAVSKPLNTGWVALPVPSVLTTAAPAPLDE